MKQILSVLFLFSYNITKAQNKMTPKEAFFYSMRVNNISPNAVIKYYGLGGDSKAYQMVDFYASTTDNYNYTKSVNDEFKKNTYLSNIYNEMTSGINSVNFNKTFFISGKAT